MVPLSSSTVSVPQAPLPMTAWVCGPQLSPPGSFAPGITRAVQTSLPVRRSWACGSEGCAGDGKKPVAPVVMIKFL